MKANSPLERLYNGIIKENPTFVLMLGMCPTLAVTTSAKNGFGMGMTTMVILALSNLMISMLRKMIPDSVRMPAYIVVVASFVTIVQFLLQGFIPSLYDSLGIYIPLIVVNCIILGRAEAYASKNGPVSSLFDGIGMGLGFTVGLTSIGIVRELIGSGKIFGYDCFQRWSYHLYSGTGSLLCPCDAGGTSEPCEDEKRSCRSSESMRREPLCGLHQSYVCK